ncbi:DNA-directed RNA polymerase subunit beta' [Candidatus Phytoplasma prunorum]|uniref:DNA-directed RNA polymerase subunit beta' n=1 Tax=Candidatus Phytoplasma prunorum TaxID=47565 RepID=UPI002FEF0EDD
MLKKTKIKNISISDRIINKLKLLGINYLEEFNTFNLNDLKKLLKEDFFDIIPILKEYSLPSDLKNLHLEQLVIEKLYDNGITDFNSLMLISKDVLYKIFSNDIYAIHNLNNLFILYGCNTIKFSSQSHLLSNSKKHNSNRNYQHFKIRLSSSDEIRQWSYGEIVNYETINYRTSKPETGGLFCQKIFGPVKDFQCICAKKQIVNKGQICSRCNVEFTESKVRRERMAHIELATPVVHTWYFNNSPSRLSILLGIKAKEIEEIVYYMSYIVIEPGKSSLNKKQIISEMEYNNYSEYFSNSFIALTGAKAIKTMLQSLDLEKNIKILRKNLKIVPKPKRNAIIKRLKIFEDFNKSENKPEWMVMDVIPVLPCGLRQMVPLDGGRFATTDSNDLYRRILNRNSRLKKQLQQKAPELIIKNEKRMLQEAVDALFDNTKSNKKNYSNINRNKTLKPLSETLRGKTGRFRQNLLGKRVDYSGRSVIIVDPRLKMHQCGIPRQMAVILFKPFVLRKLQEQGIDKTNIVHVYDRMDEKVWKALEEVVKEHPVLLNRAPTLHRLGIQAFEPKLIDGKAIRLHPLVTPAFNADFDGDQMAVYLPLSLESQAEARLLMLMSNNILDPKNGNPVVTPSQDMVLGNYYLTIEEKKSRILDGVFNVEQKNKEHQYKHRNEGKFFNDLQEAEIAFEKKEISLHTRIVIKPSGIKSNFTDEQKEKYLVTTLGKMIFNNILPSNFPYINEPTKYNLEIQTPDCYFINKGIEPKKVLNDIPIPSPFKKKFLSMVINIFFKNMPIIETSRMLDDIKSLGFKYSTIAGITISFEDINIYSKKKELLEKKEKNIIKIEEWYENGLLTSYERKNLVIKEWKEVRDQIQEGLMDDLKQDNHVFMMSDSGARGSISNFTQLMGMRGLMNNPKGEIIEVPVKTSFIEGLTVSEFFISTHGARKGSTDTALKTAESGYLTRRLVDVAQDIIIIQDDCGSELGFNVEAIKNDGKEIISLRDRILGRFLSKDVLHPQSKKNIFYRNQLVNEEICNKIIELEINKIEIRSILNCNCSRGVCIKDYGINLSTNKLVEIGEAVGVIAAQSIGEPGTQLTMRTFHTGGVASVSDITQGLPRIQELFEVRKPKGKAIISELKGKVKNIEKIRTLNPEIVILSDDKEQEIRYIVDTNSEILVHKGMKIKSGQKLTSGSIDLKELLRATNIVETQKYILEEVQSVYRAQNVSISDKHIEIIIHKMLTHLLIIYEGDTDLLPGSEINIQEFKKINLEMLKQNKSLAAGKPILLGITSSSLKSESFLSAASFQTATKILIDAAIRGKVDRLEGLKENVIVGGLIPAGTGILKTSIFEYKNSNFIKEDNY